MRLTHSDKAVHLTEPGEAALRERVARGALNFTDADEASRVGRAVAFAAEQASRPPYLDALNAAGAHEGRNRGDRSGRGRLQRACGEGRTRPALLRVSPWPSTSGIVRDAASVHYPDAADRQRVANAKSDVAAAERRLEEAERELEPAASKLGYSRGTAIADGRRRARLRRGRWPRMTRFLRDTTGPYVRVTWGGRPFARPRLSPPARSARRPWPRSVRRAWSRQGSRSSTWSTLTATRPCPAASGRVRMSLPPPVGTWLLASPACCRSAVAA